MNANESSKRDMKYDSVYTGHSRSKRSQRMINSERSSVKLDKTYEMRKKIALVSKKMENFNNLNLGARSRTKASFRNSREWRQ